jgi:hypothetical protein
VTDPDGDDVTITVTGVAQDEPLDGVADGSTSPDAIFQDSDVVLRKERGGLGNGRVYTVRFTADDGNGGTCTGTVSVCVPRDRRKPVGCIDDGEIYNSP